MEVVGDLEYRGKLGNLVFYTMNGRTFARRVRIPGKKQKPRTEGQRGMARRFAIVQKMYSFYKEEISPDIWRLAGKAAGRRGNMLFTSLNSGCFDGEGRMADPEAFHFSAGELQLPRELRVEALGGGRFRATWEDERALSSAAPSDELRAGVAYDAEPLGICWAESASGRRGDGGGEFALDGRGDTGAHVYLFFARADGTAYSPSRYFHVSLEG